MGGAGGDLAGFGDDGNGGGVDDGAVVRAMKSKLKEGAAAADPNAGGMKIRSAASQSGMSASQLDELRKQIQLLCQSVNPLGKCIDFVREDMDSMNKELQRWRTAHTEYTDQLEQERKATERIVEPLTQQLQDVELQIAEQQRYEHTHASHGRNAAVVRMPHGSASSLFLSLLSLLSCFQKNSCNQGRDPAQRLDDSTATRREDRHHFVNYKSKENRSLGVRQVAPQRARQHFVPSVPTSLNKYRNSF
jgi:hypothetical protein